MRAKSFQRIVLSASLFVICATPALAANCKKGIPCGNSCIAANRICHIGAPSEAKDVKPQELSKNTQSPMPSATAAAPALTDHAGSLVVGSEADKVYFIPGCAAAHDVAPANRRYFPDESTATTAGFRRSTIPGC